MPKRFIAPIVAAVAALTVSSVMRAQIQPWNNAGLGQARNQPAGTVGAGSPPRPQRHLGRGRRRNRGTRGHAVAAHAVGRGARQDPQGRRRRQNGARSRRSTTRCRRWAIRKGSRATSCSSFGRFRSCRRRTRCCCCTCSRRDGGSSGPTVGSFPRIRIRGGTATRSASGRTTPRSSFNQTARTRERGSTTPATRTATRCASKSATTA